MDMSPAEMWDKAAQAAKDAVEDVDPIRAVAALAVGYAVFKLVHLVATSPSIPKSVWVPLEPGERKGDDRSLPFMYRAWNKCHLSR